MGAADNPRRVAFQADGVRLVGHLHLPQSGQPAPGVVVSIPVPSVKEQVGDGYARRLAAHGLVGLVFDPRNYGESGGQPRQREDGCGKLADLAAAVTFLRQQEEVDPDRIVVLGIGLGAGYALQAAAFDPRIAGFVGVAGHYPSPYQTRATMGAAGFRQALASAIEAIERRDTGWQLPGLPIVGPPGEAAVLPPGPLADQFRQFHLTERGHHPRFENRLTTDSMYGMLLADVAMAADFLSPTPALLVHGDHDLPPADAAAARAVYARIGQPKRLVMLPAKHHTDLYDLDEHVTAAINATVEFLGQHLDPGAR
jgi:uncharacterized protein